ncbi:MAG: glycosyltransferase [Bdellovibrionota bacterium]
MPARITVIFLLYNAKKTVQALLTAVMRQTHPAFPETKQQAKWLDVIFVDDQSPDGTAAELKSLLDRNTALSHYMLVSNKPNLGLSKSLNKSLDMIKSPYVLTCHCDCIFGSEFYVANMLELLEENPNAGAITGQPLITPEKSIPFSEKVNLVANLMDIIPPATQDKLVPTGFAEGRCDAFRLDALRKAGLYDTKLRLAGEDQVLAARLRACGYEIYQAPRQGYFLSASDEQNTLLKLVRHQRLFGRAHPYILFKNSGTLAGITSQSAGANRRTRALLRMQQLVSTVVYVAVLLPLGLPLSTYLVPIALIFACKAFIFRRHLISVKLSFMEQVMFFAFQPVLDISYTIGLIQGVWLILTRSEAKPIS